jgi:hypothetical protein
MMTMAGLTKLMTIVPVKTKRTMMTMKRTMMTIDYKGSSFLFVLLFY